MIIKTLVGLYLISNIPSLLKAIEKYNEAKTNRFNQDKSSD